MGQAISSGVQGLTDQVKAEARRLGFDLVGVASADPLPDHGQRLRAWVEGGHHGTMDYMARRVDRAADPRAIVPGTRSVVVVALYYRTSPEGHDRSRPRRTGIAHASAAVGTDAGPAADAGDAAAEGTVAVGVAPAAQGAAAADAATDTGMPSPAAADDAGRAGEAGPQGRISSYAWGTDYHLVVERGLKRLATFLHAQGASVARYYVDTGPVLDRALAQRAGIGWFGKNTTIITTTGHGSYVFLGEILTDLDLAPDVPAHGDCGLCTLCMDQCPTGAIIAPGVLDARRCISYLTIEHRGWIPRQWRAAMEDMVFGCDICQTVCPWNRGLPQSAHAEFAPRSGLAFPALIPLLFISEEEFRTRFRASPVRRAGRTGLRRNAAVALGNSGDPRAIPALICVLGDPDPYVRGHAAWALGRLGGAAAVRALEERLRAEDDPEVREEVRLALDAAAGSG